MELFCYKTVPIVVTLSVIVAIVFGAVIRILQSPSGGGLGSAMFFSDGTITDISSEKHYIDILICRSGIYDSGSTITFDLSNHVEELDDLSLGEMVTVHHWIDSRDGKSVIARSVEPIEVTTDGDASCSRTR